MQKTQPIIFGIVNITPDSFSDGGAFFHCDDAVAHARKLMDNGAQVIDLGAASSHPDAASLSPAEEIKRLTPVLEALVPLRNSQKKPQLSVDSHQTEVQRLALAHNIDYLNDTSGFDDASFYSELAEAKCKLIVMHSIQKGGQADRKASQPRLVYQQMLAFFESRLEEMSKQGIAKERFILDPGMGFFLGSNPETSLYVLQNIDRLQSYFELPLMVSVSRKSFLGSINGRKVKQRAALSLGAELYVWLKQGVSYIRTHDAAALRDACLIWSRLNKAI